MEQVIDVSKIEWKPYSDNEWGPKQARFYFDNGWSLSIILGYNAYEVGVVNPKGRLAKFTDKYLVQYVKSNDDLQHIARTVSAWKTEEDAKTWAESDDGRLEWR